MFVFLLIWANPFFFVLFVIVYMFLNDFFLSKPCPTIFCISVLSSLVGFSLLKKLLIVMYISCGEIICGNPKSESLMIESLISHSCNLHPFLLILGVSIQTGLFFVSFIFVFVRCCSNISVSKS